jgi:hypothetical protein
MHFRVNDQIFLARLTHITFPSRQLFFAEELAEGMAEGAARPLSASSELCEGVEDPSTTV